MTARSAQTTRKTRETEISVSVDLDGAGKSDIATGVGFFDHMLDQLARHSLIDITVRAKGDLHIDDHHTVEDTGIALGQAVRKALGDLKGVNAYLASHGGKAITPSTVEVKDDSQPEDEGDGAADDDAGGGEG